MDFNPGKHRLAKWKWSAQILLLLLAFIVLPLHRSKAELDFLRVDHSQPSRPLVDKYSRQRILRGVTISVMWWKKEHGRPFDPELYKGKCVANNNTWTEPPLCGVEAGNGKWNQNVSWDSMNDLAQIRAAGFNVVRLQVSWALIEPTPLNYSQVYLERIAQVVA